MPIGKHKGVSFAYCNQFTFCDIYYIYILLLLIFWAVHFSNPMITTGTKAILFGEKDAADPSPKQKIGPI